ncbi:MAG: hypothetical protein AAGC54_10880 [Cyanobacteria bacterium P01_F01_bin.4]
MGSKNIRTLIKATSSFLLALLLWEVILRNLVESSPGNKTHPALGTIRKLGTSIQTQEGIARVRFNSLGMRHPEIQPKQPNEYRVLVLGDSYTFADQVADQQIFTALTESMLAKPFLNSGRKVQVINAGKPGASPANYLYAADFYNSTIHPDSVVVQLVPSDLAVQLTNSAEEFYLAEQDGQYQVVHNKSFSSGDTLAQLIISRFPKFDVLLQMSVLRVGSRQAQQLFANTNVEITPSAIANNTQTQSKAEPRLSNQEKALLDWMVQSFKRSFPELVFVYMPAINYEDFKLGRLADRTKLSDEAARNLLIEEYLAEKAEAYQIPMINMRSDFIAFYRDRNMTVKGFNNTRPGLGHFNVAGHELIAEKLVNFYKQTEL